MNEKETFRNERLILNHCQTFKNIYELSQSFYFKTNESTQWSYIIHSFDQYLKDVKNLLFVLFLFHHKTKTDPCFLIVCDDQEEKQTWIDYYTQFISNSDAEVNFNHNFVLVVTKDELEEDFPVNFFFREKSPWCKEDRIEISKLGFKRSSYNKQSPVAQITLEPITQDNLRGKHYCVVWDAVVVTSPDKLLGRDKNAWKYLYAINNLASHYKIVVNSNNAYAHSDNIDYYFLLYFLANTNDFSSDGPLESDQWCDLNTILPESSRMLKIRNLYKTFQISPESHEIVVKRGSSASLLHQAKRARRAEPLTHPSSTPHHTNVVEVRTLTLPHDDFMLRAFRRRFLGGFLKDFYEQERIYLTKMLAFYPFLKPHIRDPYTYVLYTHGSARDLCIALGNFPHQRLLSDLDVDVEIHRLFILDPLLERPLDFPQQVLRVVKREVVVVAYYKLKEDALYNVLFPLSRPHFMSGPGVIFTRHRSAIKHYSATTPLDEVSDFMSDDDKYRFYLLSSGTQTTALVHHHPTTFADTTTTLYGFDDDIHRHFTLYDTFFAITKHMDMLYTEISRRNIEEISRNFQERRVLTACSLSLEAQITRINGAQVYSVWDKTRRGFVEQPPIDPETALNPTASEQRLSDAIAATFTHSFVNDKECTLVAYTPDYHHDCFVSHDTLCIGDVRVTHHTITNMVAASISGTLTLSMPILMAAMTESLCTKELLINSNLTLADIDRDRDPVRSALAFVAYLMHPSQRIVMGDPRHRYTTLLCCDKPESKGVLGVMQHGEREPFELLSEWIGGFSDSELGTASLKFYPRMHLEPLKLYYAQFDKLQLEITHCRTFHIVSHATDLFVSIKFSGIKNHPLVFGIRHQ